MPRLISLNNKSIQHQLYVHPYERPGDEKLVLAWKKLSVWLEVQRSEPGKSHTHIITRPWEVCCGRSLYKVPWECKKWVVLIAGRVGSFWKDDFQCGRAEKVGGKGLSRRNRVYKTACLKIRGNMLSVWTGERQGEKDRLKVWVLPWFSSRNKELASLWRGKWTSPCKSRDWARTRGEKFPEGEVQLKIKKNLRSVISSNGAGFCRPFCNHV